MARKSVALDGDYTFLNDGQLRAELSKCLNCFEKPCLKACPCACSPADFIQYAQKGKPTDFERAAGLIMSKNPFGGVCGIVCPEKHCMSACSRKNLDEPIQIPAVQATIVQRARELGVFPKFESAASSGKKVAVIGGGPSGLGAAAVLQSRGHQVTVYEKRAFCGGDACTIPKFRLPANVLAADIKFVEDLGVAFKYSTEVTEPASLLKEYDAVCVAIGLGKDRLMNFPGVENCVFARDYLRNPEQYAEKLGNNIAVVGGGAVAVDVATTARRLGVDNATIFYRRSVAEMPIDTFERHEIQKFSVEIVPRVLPCEIRAENGKITGVTCKRVSMPNRRTGKTSMVEVEGGEQQWNDITGVVLAVGQVSDAEQKDNKGVFYAGDFANGASTVVEASAYGKNVGMAIHSYLVGKEFTMPTNPARSEVEVLGYNQEPVSLETDFLGLKMINPFLLSASPVTDGYKEMKLALDAGWAGGVLKTAFDNLPIHIPNQYMGKFSGEKTYGNCDNVSGHTLDRVCKEIGLLRKEYPDRIIMGGTGGPVTGDFEHDKKGWQSNTLKLEKAGAQAVEYSLSCPQGGDGSEGAIVSQSVKATQRIIDWIMEVSDPNVPKFFKLTAAVTSIAVIVKAVREVLDKYPGKKAGVTLANSFPGLGFRPRSTEGGDWEEGIVYGLAGEGVLPISYLSLASSHDCGVAISGNGGVYDYESAANFLALGVQNVQICTLAMTHGVECISDLTSGLSHFMESRGIKSIAELRGKALPNPIADFMDLPGKKKISTLVKPKSCISCGNCVRCPYQAIKMVVDVEDGKARPVIDPERCVGCSMCVLKCPGECLTMCERTKEQYDACEHGHI
eukprot:GCRY01000495.1.p1 GENE.GCRY01000495.1~~GCRY01000495.1.p1  ORF type:complete len:847 (+),score=254.42 GCRY01000495.1:74-2614(+)